MRISDIMTSPVVGIAPTTSITEAARLMLVNRISGLPVVTVDHQIVGVVTEGDFLRRSELGTEKKRPRWLQFVLNPGRQAAEYIHAHGRQVQDVMSPEPLTIAPEASLETAIETMLAHKIKRLLVVDQGQLAGIVSRADVMRAILAISASEASASAPTNAGIRAAIEAELSAQQWSHYIRVKVDKGTVELVGMIFDEPDRRAAIVVAENVPGVVQVIDGLALVDPLSGFTISPSPFQRRRARS